MGLKKYGVEKLQAVVQPGSEQLAYWLCKTLYCENL